MNLEKFADILVIIIGGWFFISLICVWLLAGIFRQCKKERKIMEDNDVSL